MSISVIVPTTGRDTLASAIASCAGADEIIVVADHAQGPVETSDLPERVIWANVMGGDNGYTARTKGIELATSTHLAFMDDDDVYLPGAIETMRSCESYVPVILRMDHPVHGVIWKQPNLMFGNVSTQMFLIPNKRDRLGVWAPHVPGLKEPGGDFTFIAGCVEKMGGPIWREELVAEIRPHERGPSITVVTPWKDHVELKADFDAALAGMTAGDRLIVVDDRSDPPLYFAAAQSPRPGFAPACNEGLRLAETDAVLFLNNDIIATEHGWIDRLRRELKPGALIGAKLTHSPHGNVDGVSLPYLEGWCLAGMTEDLRDLGGWDESFAEPSYYGDNDLCFRARAAGMPLREVRIGLRHLGNVTAGRWDDPAVAAASKTNRELFAKKVRRELASVDDLVDATVA